MAARPEERAPELAGTPRAAALALAGLLAHFAARLFSSQVHDVVTPLTLACINGIMRKKGVIPAAEIERFWKEDGNRLVLRDAGRRQVVDEAAGRMGEAMGRLVLEILGHGEGAALAAAGVARARTLVKRLAQGGPVFTGEEYRKMTEGSDPEVFSTTEDLRQALRRAREGQSPLGPAEVEDAARGAVLTTGFFFACFAKSWTYIIGSKISTPLMGQYQKTLCEQGLTTPERLIELWSEEEEVQKTMEGLTIESLGDAGENIGDCIVRLFIDVVDAAAAPLTPAAAARAEALLRRMGAENKAFSEEEVKRMEGGWHREVPRDAGQLEAALEKVLRVQAH